MLLCIINYREVPQILIIATVTIYRIRIYMTPLLIKPRLQENSMKIWINRHFFVQKFEKFQSYLNRPPP